MNIIKHFTDFILLLALGIISISCTEELDCSKYEIEEGRVMLNGTEMFPVAGTQIKKAVINDYKFVRWIIRAVEDSCSTNNTLILKMDLETTHPVTGTFEFSTNSAVDAEIRYNQEVDGTGGTTSSISSGSVTITGGTNGIFSLEVDGETTDGEPFTMFVEYQF